MVGLLDGGAKCCPAGGTGSVAAGHPPQAASVESTFSHFGWMQNKVLGHCKAEEGSHNEHSACLAQALLCCCPAAKLQLWCWFFAPNQLRNSNTAAARTLHAPPSLSCYYMQVRNRMGVAKLGRLGAV